MQKQRGSHSWVAANGNIVGYMLFVVRRALQEKCVDTTLRRCILSEARRVGFDANSGSVAGDEIIWTVAQRLSARLAARIQMPRPRSRSEEETIRN